MSWSYNNLRPKSMYKYSVNIYVLYIYKPTNQFIYVNLCKPVINTVTVAFSTHYTGKVCCLW